MRFFVVLVIASAAAEGRSLIEIACDLNPRHCDSYKASSGAPHTVRYLSGGSGLAAPSAGEFGRWQNYERGEAGTGLISDAGPAWGQGLGDVNIATGLGVQTPVGGLGIRRDFDLAFGGSGRSGGRAFGFGNGHQRQSGSAPWAWP